jgi:predicted MFS family arabinose efflux permease
VTAPRFLPLYLCFAAAYVMSYVYRTVNAVISPDLTASLGVSASSLGLLTSAYFLAFAAMQIPAGMLLDRYGPRRVEPVLLAVAGCGALAFAASNDLGGLAFARALIGAGVSVCLMAPLKAIAAWYSRERQASLGAWMMVAGGIGALLSTAPLAAALAFVSWRGIFVGLAALTFAAALWIFFAAPDTPPPGAGEARSPWRGVRIIFASPRLWWIAPLDGLGMGAFMAIQGLWSVPWLMDVDGYTRNVAADHLLVVGLTTLAGYAAVALLSTRLARAGVLPRHMFAAGFALQMLSLALIVARAPFTYATWGVYGLTAAVNILGYTLLNEGFPRELVARANTALNLAVFLMSFAMQWGIGLIADAARAWLGVDAGGGLRAAFIAVLVAEALAFAWFMLGWRRHARAAPLARIAA